jgi:MFS transporter, DHA2 family, metal-tetracycline-proton antiporter
MEVSWVLTCHAKRIKNERVLYLALRYNVLFTVMNTTMFNVALPIISYQLALSLFFITIFSVIMLPVYYIQLPTEETGKSKLDLLGIALLSIGVICALLLISTGNSLFFVGLFSFWIFWVHIQHKEQPFVSPFLLKKQLYLYSLFFGFFAFFINFSVLFMVPLLLAHLFHATPAKIGLVIFPGAICSAAASIYIGRLLDRKGAFPLLVAGVFLIIGALFLFSSFGYLSIWSILFFYLINSSGFACIQAGIPYYLARLLPKEEFGTAIGLQQLIQFFGGAFGVICVGLLLEQSKQKAVNPLWLGTEPIYSNVFLFLQGPGAMAGILLWGLILVQTKSNTKANHFSEN